MEKDTRLFAFWQNSDFPYLLGGEIEKFVNGKVQTYNYGKGFLFSPIAIFPLEEGTKLLEEIHNLKEQYWTDQRDLTKTYIRKAMSTFSATGNVVLQEHLKRTLEKKV